jgi:hypothetical protein
MVPCTLLHARKRSPLSPPSFAFSAIGSHLQRHASLECQDRGPERAALLRPDARRRKRRRKRGGQDEQVEDRLEIFETGVMQQPEVLECYLMTGEADYLLRVVVPDVADYERFLRAWLTRLEGVAGSTQASLKQVKYWTTLPLGSARTAEPAAGETPCVPQATACTPHAIVPLRDDGPARSWKCSRSARFGLTS